MSRRVRHGLNHGLHAIDVTPDSLTDCAQARWARGGEDGFAARVATKAAELRASRAYVLDGLSVEEYAETKLREEDYKKSLDLGAWGPRFKRTAAPGAFGKAWVASFWMGGRPPPPAARYE